MKIAYRYIHLALSDLIVVPPTLLMILALMIGRGIVTCSLQSRITMIIIQIVLT